MLYRILLLSVKQHHLLKRQFFPHWVVLTFLIKISWPLMCGLTSGLSVLLVCMPILVSVPHSFLKFIYISIYFYLHWVFVALCRLPLVAAREGLLFVAAHRLLIVVASPVVEHKLQGVQASVVAAHRLRNCSDRMEFFQTGIVPISSAWAGRVLTPLHHQGSLVLHFDYCGL